MPALGRPLDAHDHIKDGQPLGPPRGSDQAHLSLLGRSSPLSPIARTAAGHNILPGCRPSHGSWSHVIIGEISHVELVSTVLAPPLVSQVDIVSSKSDLLIPWPDESEKTDYRR